MKKIYTTIVGSKMHGLSTPSSDEDVRYITLHPIRDILSPFKNEDVKVSGNNEDVESWELRHFVKHLTQGNPTIYEVIKSPLYEPTEYAEKIRGLMPLAFDARKVLMAHAGYAEAQLKRYLRKASLDFVFHLSDTREDPENKPNVDTRLLGIPKWESVQRGKGTEFERVGNWEENHLRRIPKSIVAGYRVLAQGRQLLESGDFKPVIKDYSPELHDKLMSIKLMDANTITWLFANEHLNEIEAGIKELHSYFDSLPEERKNIKPNIEAIEDVLCDVYGV